MNETDVLVFDLHLVCIRGVVFTAIANAIINSRGVYCFNWCGPLWMSTASKFAFSVIHNFSLVRMSWLMFFRKQPNLQVLNDVFGGFYSSVPFAEWRYEKQTGLNSNPSQVVLILLFSFFAEENFISVWLYYGSGFNTVFLIFWATTIDGWESWRGPWLRDLPSNLCYDFLTTRSLLS